MQRDRHLTNNRLTSEIHSYFVNQKLRFIIVDIANIDRKIQVGTKWWYSLVVRLNANLKLFRRLLKLQLCGNRLYV